MARKGKKFIFTDIDLDGAMSYLLFLWLNGAYIPYISTRVTDFHKSFTGWLKYHDIKQYDQIYILDLDISQDSLELVDHENVVIIDHHDTHVQNKHRYKNAKVFIEEKPSCSRYIYELLHTKSVTELTDRHKYLTLLVDDYDSYKLNLKESHDLNLLFWNYQGDRLAKFVKDFQPGFCGFTDQQKQVIEFYKKKIGRTISELTMHEAVVPIKNKPYKFVSTFATECINEVADHLITNYSADISLVINLNSNKVSFRKNKDVEVNLGDLAKKLADGGGHKYAAGGQLNETFMNFSKIFKPVS